MHPPQGVPAAASVATLASIHVWHVVEVPASPQAVSNAVVSVLVHSPWCFFAET
jgi:hypothetical protein